MAIPEMPKDWWPDHIVVTGKSSDVELHFAITRDGFQYVEHEITPNVNGLREAIWQSLHMNPDERKAMFG